MKADILIVVAGVAVVGAGLVVLSLLKKPEPVQPEPQTPQIYEVLVPDVPSTWNPEVIPPELVRQPNIVVPLTTTKLIELITPVTFVTKEGVIYHTERGL